MHTLFNEVQQRTIKRMEGGEEEAEDERSDLLLHYTQNAVCILDEFDSLIMEHHIVNNTVFHMENVVAITKLEKKHFRNGRRLFRALSNNSKESIEARHSFFGRMRRHNLVQALSTFVKEGSMEPGHSGINELGIKVDYIGGTLYEMSKGTLFGTAVPLSTLTYLQGFRNIVGLSGSIEERQVCRFSGLFGHTAEKSTTTFLRVPNFYGLQEAQREQRVADEDIASESAWLAKIQEDVNYALRLGQPVLVFANPSDAGDFDRVERALQEVCRQDRSLRFNKIDSEEHVNDEMLNTAATPGNITLSTHVAGRGADFAVKPDVSRKGGLHVIITFVPRAKGNRRDDRLLTQMIGRTARMQSRGSYSILARNGKQLAKEDTDPIEEEHVKAVMHRLFVDTVRTLRSLPREGVHADVWRRLGLLAFMMPKLKAMPRRMEMVKDKKKKELRKRDRKELAIYFLTTFLRVNRKVMQRNGLPKTEG
jgi:hypothetical protein